jgi:hypothetical protein
MVIILKVEPISDAEGFAWALRIGGSLTGMKFLTLEEGETYARGWVAGYVEAADEVKRALGNQFSQGVLVVPYGMKVDTIRFRSESSENGVPTGTQGGDE